MVLVIEHFNEDRLWCATVFGTYHTLSKDGFLTIRHIDYLYRKNYITAVVVYHKCKETMIIHSSVSYYISRYE